MIRGRVLLVEDDQGNREIVKLALELEGVAVSEASDGASALERLREELPDLILLDLLMPEMSGGQFVDELAKDPSSPASQVPVVVISATVAKAAPIQHRIQGVIRKPIDLEELLAVVRKYCGARHSAGRLSAEL